MTDLELQMRYYFSLMKKHLNKIVVAVVVLLLLFTSVKTVGPEEEGVVLYLGQYNRKVEPGLNFIIPFGIEKLYKTPVQRQLKHEFGFRTAASPTWCWRSPTNSTTAASITKSSSRRRARRSGA